MGEGFLLVNVLDIEVEVELDVGAAVWCLEVLQDVINFEELKPFFRKHRGSNYVVLAETVSNRRGTFLKFTKLYNGSVKNIIIPGGLSRRGWRSLAGCLDNLVGKRFWNLKGGFKNAFDRSQRTNMKEVGMKPSWKRIVESKKDKGDKAGSSTRSHSQNILKRSWRNAVLVVR